MSDTTLCERLLACAVLYSAYSDIRLSPMHKREWCIQHATVAALGRSDALAHIDAAVDLLHRCAEYKDATENEQ